MNEQINEQTEVTAGPTDRTGRPAWLARWTDPAGPDRQADPNRRRVWLTYLSDPAQLEAVAAGLVKEITRLRTAIPPAGTVDTALEDAAEAARAALEVLQRRQAEADQAIAAAALAGDIADVVLEYNGLPARIVAADLEAIACEVRVLDAREAAAPGDDRRSLGLAIQELRLVSERLAVVHMRDAGRGNSSRSNIRQRRQQLDARRRQVIAAQTQALTMTARRAAGMGAWAPVGSRD